jgi:hypothetical protein
MGAALTEAGSWREAEPPLTQSLALLEANFGSFHLDIARVCNSLAIVYYKVSLFYDFLQRLTPRRHMACLL